MLVLGVLILLNSPILSKFGSKLTLSLLTGNPLVNCQREIRKSSDEKLDFNFDPIHRAF